MNVFVSFNELHFRPTFDTGPVRRCIAIVRAIQANCLAKCYHDNICNVHCVHEKTVHLSVFINL